MTELQNSLSIDLADPASLKTALEVLRDHIVTLHDDVLALAGLLAMTITFASTHDPKASLAVRLEEATEGLDGRAVKILRALLIDGGNTMPPKGGTHLRVVVSNESAQAKAA